MSSPITELLVFLSQNTVLPLEILLKIYTNSVDLYIKDIKTKAHPQIKYINEHFINIGHLKSYKLNCILRRISINIKRHTIQNLLTEYSNCNCCYVHNVSKPDKFCNYYNFNRIDSEPASMESLDKYSYRYSINGRCPCLCRYMARQMAAPVIDNTRDTYDIFGHDSNNLNSLIDFVKYYGIDEGRKRWTYCFCENFAYGYQFKVPGLDIDVSIDELMRLRNFRFEKLRDYLGVEFDEPIEEIDDYLFTQPATFDSWGPQDVYNKRPYKMYSNF